MHLVHSGYDNCDFLVILYLLNQELISLSIRSSLVSFSYLFPVFHPDFFIQLEEDFASRRMTSLIIMQAMSSSLTSKLVKY